MQKKPIALLLSALFVTGYASAAEVFTPDTQSYSESLTLNSQYIVTHTKLSSSDGQEYSLVFNMPAKEGGGFDVNFAVSANSGIAEVSNWASVTFKGMTQPYGGTLYAYQRYDTESIVKLTDIGVVNFGTDEEQLDGMGMNTLGGNIELTNIGTLNMNTTSNAIWGQQSGGYNSNIVVEAKAINIKADASAVGAVIYGNHPNGEEKNKTSITLTADTIDIESTNGSALSISGCYNGSCNSGSATLKVNGTQSANVKGTTYGVLVNRGEKENQTSNFEIVSEGDVSIIGDTAAVSFKSSATDMGFSTKGKFQGNTVSLESNGTALDISESDLTFTANTVNVAGAEAGISAKNSNLSFGNGNRESTVNVAGDIKANTSGFEMNNTTLHLQGDSTADINTISGENVTLLIDQAGEGKVKINENTANNVTLAGSAELNDSVANAEVALETLQKSFAIENGVADHVAIAEGAINDGITADINEDGTLSNKEVKTNTKMDALNSVTALSLLTWRHDMNDLTKRMGELRDGTGTIGSWARLYGSEQEYGAQGIKSKNTSIQVGADYALAEAWTLGAALSYTDGNAEYDAGSADNKAYGFALYGTWLHESGQFVDLIAKYSRIESDFKLNGMDGSYDNNAWSLSAEYGWHFPIADVAFVEPQVELTYGTVMGDNLTTSNEVRLEQDDYTSFIGRVGLRAGFYFPEKKGNIYARASVLHDFDGEMNTKASYGTTSSRNIVDDLGGTWYEFGVGANFNLTERTYTYVDLEKSTGGEVKENWRWNIGLRHVW